MTWLENYLLKHNLVTQTNISARGANQNFKFTWFGCPGVCCGVEVPEGFTVQSEGDSLLLTGFEFDLVEGFELFFGSGKCGFDITYVELHDLFVL